MLRQSLIKRAVVLSLIACLLLPTYVFADAESFTDVSSAHWAHPFIDTLKSTDIISGYPDGTFKPNANVRIDEFIAMTVKALGYRFESLSSDWAKPYVDKAIELKIIQDREFTSYSAQINREQMTSVVVNAIALNEFKLGSNLEPYIKNEVSDYYLVTDHYKQNMLESYKWGIITGFTDKTFKPKNYSTRAEAAAVIAKIENVALRTPFEKTYVKYVMLPSSVGDGIDDASVEKIPYYAPLFNGKHINEVVDVAEIIKKNVNAGKGWMTFAYNPLTQATGGSYIISREAFEAADAIDNNFQSAMAMAELPDLRFGIETNDLTSQYRPYKFGMNKKVSIMNSYDRYSDYIFEYYGEKVTPILTYLFEKDAPEAIAMFKQALDYKGESVRIQKTINGRFYDLVYSSNAINITISLKK